MKLKWRLFLLKLRYLLRDPYDVVGNREQAQLIDELEEAIQ